MRSPGVHRAISVRLSARCGRRATMTRSLRSRSTAPASASCPAISPALRASRKATATTRPRRGRSPSIPDRTSACAQSTCSVPTAGSFGDRIARADRAPQARRPGGRGGSARGAGADRRLFPQIGPSACQDCFRRPRRRSRGPCEGRDVYGRSWPDRPVLGSDNERAARFRPGSMIEAGKLAPLE